MKLREVCADPEQNSKRLVNRGGQRSARVGMWRVLFDLDDVYKHIL